MPPRGTAEPEHLEDVSMATRTTLALGGPVRHLMRCASAAEVRQALHFAHDRRLPIFILGGGSNLVVADEGFDGVAIELADQRLSFDVDGDTVVATAGAGADWDGLVARCVAEGLAGVECLSGIPGRVGATPVQNIGAYGQDVKETIDRVSVLDLESGEVERIAGADCGFQYRDSHFKGEWRGRTAVLGVSFRLHRRRQGIVRYPELRRHLGLPAEPADGESRPDLDTVRRAVLSLRRTKSMVLDADDPNRRSAGSFFVNPLLAPDRAERVVAAARAACGEEPPRWPEGDRVKIPAAWLIERAGFAKGHRHGRVGISSRHALALVNLGGASTRELVALAAAIRAAVHRSFGVVLEPEPTFLGFSGGVEQALGPLPGGDAS